MSYALKAELFAKREQYFIYYLTGFQGRHFLIDKIFRFVLE